MHHTHHHRPRRPLLAVAALTLALGLSACGATADPTLAEIDAAGVTTELAKDARVFTSAQSPTVRGDTAGIIVSSSQGAEGPDRIALSADGGASWADATIDGAPATDISLEHLAAGPAGWLALGRAATGAKDLLTVLTSRDGRAFTRTGDGLTVPAGATLLAAGTTSGWTLVFRKAEDPWQVATSTDGTTWSAGAASDRGLAAPGKLYLNDLATSGRELVVVGQAETDSSQGTAISSVLATSQDGGLTWRADRSSALASAAPHNGGLRAAAWSSAGFAAVGWGWSDPAAKAPQATLLVPHGRAGYSATTEAGLRDGTQRNQGADELDTAEGTYLVAGNDGEASTITQHLKIGKPGSWQEVHLPALPQHAHRFPEGNVAVPGGFLSFHTVNRSLASETEVFFIAPSGEATLRATLPGPRTAATIVSSFAPVAGGVEALGYVGTQAALFRRTEAKSFASPTVLPTERPVRFSGLRAAGGARLLFGQRQLSNNSHAVAWTSTDGSEWNTGSEALLSPGPQDKTVIRDGLVARGRFLVVGEVDDRNGTVSGSVAARGPDDGQWTRLASTAFAGTEKRAVKLLRVAEAADGSIIAVGTATEGGLSSLKIWRSVDGTAFAEVPAPTAPPGATTAPGELIRIGGRLALATVDELPDRTRRVTVYESGDHGATWSSAPQDPLEAAAPIGLDLASDGDDAVLVATVGTRTSSRVAALRRTGDGVWRALELGSRALDTDRTAVTDVTLTGGSLLIAAETGSPTERAGTLVEITLPRRQ